jgi:hypothetical protein
MAMAVVMNDEPTSKAELHVDADTSTKKKPSSPQDF